jgi:hypothetical protein
MRTLQPSFARGEITPLLHARVDLALYNTSVAGLRNFIVMPQGGVTRRPGFERIGNAATTSGDKCPVRLIPFVYDREDAHIIELYDHGVRVWLPSSGTVIWQDEAPYAQDDLAMIKFVQNGNVIFMTHRDYPVQMLTRRAIDDWEWKEFPFGGGPWLPDNPDNADIEMLVNGFTVVGGERWFRLHASEPYFTQDMVGTLIKFNYMIPGTSIEGDSVEAPGTYTSESVEVGAQWYLRTTGAWKGTITLQKSLDNGTSWINVRTYHRTDPALEGQLELSDSENESNVIYRITAQHEQGTNVPIHFSFTASGFSKSNIFRITRVDSPILASGTWEKEDFETGEYPIMHIGTKDWQAGAWGGVNGWPAAVAFYQDRLAFASTWAQLQTVWMSRVGDYTNFSVSDPVREDDAINITLSAEENDGIHSLLSMADILAFTASSEWRIKGAGDNGAIAPNAVVAHRQDNIGSAPIQPILAQGQPFLVQMHRKEVHVLSYAMDMDGYSGSNVSVMSQHLFSWKTQEDAPPADRRIMCFAYQQIPDELIWFVLADGSAVTCTYLVEHGVIAWARQETEGFVGDVTSIPANGYSQAWFAVSRGGIWGIERLASREDEALFTDAGSYGYESSLETLRLNLDSQSGSLMSANKLIPRLAVFSTRSKGIRIAPATDKARAKWRELKWDYGPEITESEIMLDSGFERGAAVQIWTDRAEPLTILALSPMFTAGR